MSLKKKLKKLLSASEHKKEAEQEAHGLQHHAPAEEPQPETGESVPFQNEALLELPQEHPLYQLYNLRRRDGGSLPSPRLCLDEDGELPSEMIRREKVRLRTVVNKECNARLKEARGKKGQGKDKNNGKSKDKPAGKDAEKDDGKARKKAGEKKEAEPVVLDARPCFFLSADKLYAWVFVLPPVGAGEELSRDMLYRAMVQQGISYGVNTRLADRLSHDEHKYFTLYPIAKGKPAFDGENGNIIDRFPRVIERVLEVDEYDQVDYTALNLIRNVKQGQEICRLIKPTEGEPGRTVLDQEVPAKSGKSVPLPKGRNTEISEDECSLLASISGHVEYTGHSFQVKPVLDIPGNVDFSTGSINFLGDINIKGDVLSGFTVRAMGNIHVDGVIEAGSAVEAGGDLVVVKGILGDGTTIVRSHRSVFSKYIENSVIYARENLQTDCILNGSIYCDGEVLVCSGRGSIMGGRIWAAGKVTAKAVGAPSECRTAIALGGLPCTNFERETVRKELRELELELEKLECQPDNPVKASLLSKLRVKLSAAEMKFKQLEEELAGIKPDEEKEEKGRLECGVVYAGTEISFGDEMIRLRHEHRQCVAKLVNGEIVVT
jgi:hypothetical protein